jgi:hypothetical protein
MLQILRITEIPEKTIISLISTKKRGHYLNRPPNR